MNEIKCPHCGGMFTIDEAGFAAILEPVRDAEFDKEVRRHEELLATEKQQAVQLAVAEALGKAQGERRRQGGAHCGAGGSPGCGGARARERGAPRPGGARARAGRRRGGEGRPHRRARAAGPASSQKRAFETEKQLAVQQARSALERERDALAAQVKFKDAEKCQATSALKEQLAIELKAKDDIIAYKEGEIERYKDMKARLSTKLVGESLEQHCEVEFNKLRATAFPRAYFEKDNDASEGSKGDFIFRECDEEGNEIVSIMFEMKNESDESAYQATRTRSSSRSSTPTARRKAASTRCWSPCSNPRASCTTRASWTCRTGSRRCTSSGRSSSSR